jgi:hypothetical protein
VARQPTGTSTVSVLFGGVDKTGSLTVPSTGGWQTWADVNRTGVSLSAGQQVMRISMTGGSYNVNWIEITAAPSTPVATIYGDALAADWTSWSWSATVDFNGTNPVRVGSRAANVTYQAWGGLSLRKGTAQSTAGYSVLKFWVHGGTGAAKSLRVYTQTADAGGESPSVVVSAPASAWAEITVALASLGSPASIKRVNIQENGGAAQPLMTFDDIRLTP